MSHRDVFTSRMMSNLDGNQDAEIARLLTAIKRIDAINDNPAHFSAEINAVCDTILRPHLAPAVPSDQRGSE